MTTKNRPLWKEFAMIIGMTVLLLSTVFMIGCTNVGPCELVEREPYEVDEDGEPITLNVQCPY